jgi:hypothetical protein
MGGRLTIDAERDRLVSVDGPPGLEIVAEPRAH